MVRLGNVADPGASRARCRDERPVGGGGLAGSPATSAIDPPAAVGAVDEALTARADPAQAASEPSRTSRDSSRSVSLGLCSRDPATVVIRSMAAMKLRPGDPWAGAGALRASASRSR